MIEKDIRNKYRRIHDNLSEDYYDKHLMSKEDFDYYHGENWNALEAELIAEGYLILAEPARDLAQEIDELKDEVKALKDK